MLDQGFSRRRLIGGAFALAGSMAVGTTRANAGFIVPGSEVGGVEKRLAIRSCHTNERYDACYFRNGSYDPQGLAEIAHALRDWRTGQTAPIDRELIDLLVTLRARLDVDARKPFDLISGYRSPHTNAALRAAGGEGTGVATKSQHMLGKASDIALPGVPLARVKEAALSLARGGVGYYPRDGFVHVDTGRVRTW